jgi:hypothetical protein
MSADETALALGNDGGPRAGRLASVTASEKTRLTEDELWAQLCALPEHLMGEIIDGELFVQPRPRPRRARVIGELFSRIQRVFDGDGEGPAAGGSSWSQASSSQELGRSFPTTPAGDARLCPIWTSTRRSRPARTGRSTLAFAGKANHRLDVSGSNKLTIDRVEPVLHLRIGNADDDDRRTRRGGILLRVVDLKSLADRTGHFIAAPRSRLGLQLRMTRDGPTVGPSTSRRVLTRCARERSLDGRAPGRSSVSRASGAARGRYRPKLLSRALTLESARWLKNGNGSVG